MGMLRSMVDLILFSRSFLTSFLSQGRWIWSLPKDSFGLFLSVSLSVSVELSYPSVLFRRLLAVLLAWAGFRFWKRK